MLGQVNTRLQLETCRQSIKKYEQVNNLYRFSRFESMKFCGTQEHWSLVDFLAFLLQINILQVQIMLLEQSKIFQMQFLSTMRNY